jgi:Calponin homology (CH) domain
LTVISLFFNHVFLLDQFSDERESVQKKTFTKWINSHLGRVGCKIQDLYVDLRDGKMLIKLLEVLSGERLVCTAAFVVNDLNAKDK